MSFFATISYHFSSNPLWWGLSAIILITVVMLWRIIMHAKKSRYLQDSYRAEIARALSAMSLSLQGMQRDNRARYIAENGSMLPLSGDASLGVKAFAPIEGIAFIASDASIISEDLLAEAGISIRRLPAQDSYNINAPAEFLGKRYSIFKELLSLIKQNMPWGHDFKLSIKGYSAQRIKDTCQFCEQLHTMGFFDTYVAYHEEPKSHIHIKTTTFHGAQNFFSGKWLERYTLITVRKVIDKLKPNLSAPLNFSYLLNPVVTLASGATFEFDILFQINGFFYWIEAKSGEFHTSDLEKYAAIAKMLVLGEGRAMVVLADVSHARARKLSQTFGLAIFQLSLLEKTLTALIRADHGN